MKGGYERTDRPGKFCSTHAVDKVVKNTCVECGKPGKFRRSGNLGFLCTTQVDGSSLGISSFLTADKGSDFFEGIELKQAEAPVT